jgi:hypothetical protein
MEASPTFFVPPLKTTVGAFPWYSKIENNAECIAVAMLNGNQVHGEYQE